MLTLDQLSPELLAEIFESVSCLLCIASFTARTYSSHLQIYKSSRHTIFSLICVNRTISDAALPFVYREVTFNFDQRQKSNATSGSDRYSGSLPKLDSLLRLPPDSAVWKGVRTVTVHSGEDPDARWNKDTAEPPFTPSEEAVWDRWASFIEFLSRVINLEKLVFDCVERVPIVLLKHLEDKHPSCGLHVKNWTRLRCDVKVGDSYEEALARSPCLRSIDAQFFHGELPLLDFNTAAFSRILALSPNIEDISLISQDNGGCVVYGFTDEQVLESERETKRFEAEKPLRKRSVKRISINCDWPSSSLLRSWEAFIDLRAVKVLELKGLNDPEWIGYAADNGIFKRLRHLSFEIVYYSLDRKPGEQFKSSLQNFLYSLPNLESLSIVNYHGYVDVPLVLRHFGTLLRSLSLHQVENPNGPRPTLCRSDLELIRSEAPHIEHLELDLNRTADPENSEDHHYRILSSFPHLRGLTLHYDLKIHSRGFLGRLEDSDMNVDCKGYAKPDWKDFAVAVWRAIAQGVQLEVLCLYFGEFEREMEFGEPTPWVEAEQYYRQQIHDSRNESPDDLKALKLQIVGRGEPYFMSLGLEWDDYSGRFD